MKAAVSRFLRDEERDRNSQAASGGDVLSRSEPETTSSTWRGEKEAGANPKRSQSRSSEGSSSASGLGEGTAARNHPHPPPVGAFTTGAGITLKHLHGGSGWPECSCRVARLSVKHALLSHGGKERVNYIKLSTKLALCSRVIFHVRRLLIPLIYCKTTRVTWLSNLKRLLVCV